MGLILEWEVVRRGDVEADMRRRTNTAGRDDTVQHKS